MAAMWCAAMLFLSCGVRIAEGHGRLIEPPSRGSMWRYGFNTPPDYNDHETNCGGFTRQWTTNEGRCGPCGDAFDMPEPRAHELGGAYGLGVVARSYRAGAQIVLRVELTANHQGYFEFRVCPNNVPRMRAAQDCLDKFLLTSARTPSETRYFPGNRSGVLETRYLLPIALRCRHCVLQWRYLAGNQWGKCENMTEAVGCGPQEEFRACADIAILAPKGEPDVAGEPDVVSLPPSGTVLLVPGAALGAVLTLFVATYIYFYHARGRVKTWVQAVTFW